MLIDIKPLYDEMYNNIVERVKKFNKSPVLAAVTYNPDESTKTYLKSQEKLASKLGINYKVFEAVSSKELKEFLVRLSSDDNVNGIFLTHPLPKDVDEMEIVNMISPEKDVEGRHPFNLGMIIYEKSNFIPCTAEAVIKILNFLGDTKSKRVTIVGRSNTVGKPLALLLLMKSQNATVSVCHTGTPNIREYTFNSDIVVVAAGRPKLLGKEDFKQGTVIIDVGINVTDTGIVGDVDPEVSEICDITPVPGGVGKITTLLLMENTVKSFERMNE